MSSREKLDMDMNTSESNNRNKFPNTSSPNVHHPKSSKRKSGFFVRKRVLFLLFLTAAFCIVGVAVLTAYLSLQSCGCRDATSASSDGHTGSENSDNVTPIKALDDVSDSNSTSDKLFVRLPTNVIPEHYDVQLQPFIAPGLFYFNGNVSIKTKCSCFVSVGFPTENFT